MKKPISQAAVNKLILDFTLHAGRLGSLITRNITPIQVVAGIIAFTFGLIGWWLQHDKPTDPRALVDVVYRTIQLITLQFPSNTTGQVNIYLQIARFVVPVVAVLASFQVLVGSITRPLRLFLLPRSVGHLVVCGSESLTGSALKTLASRGRQVVIVAPAITKTRRETLEGLGLTVVEADPMQPATLRKLHLSYAAALFLTSEDDVANLNLAMLAFFASLERSSALPPLTVAVLIERETLAVELDLAFDELSQGHQARYHRLCPEREGARLELSRFAPVFLKPSRDVAAHVLVVGLSGNWQPIVAQLIAASQDHPDKRAVVTFVVDQAEGEAIANWHDERPELDLIADIVILPRRAGAILPAEKVLESWRTKYGPPQLAVVLRDDEDSISTAFALRRPGTQFGTENAPILVRQSKEDRLLSSLGKIKNADRNMATIIAIGGLVRAESIERVLDSKGDEMAIAIHERYLETVKTLGQGSATALRKWDDLPENQREANRSSAEHAPILFAAAGLGFAATEPNVKPVQLSDTELESLARIEHRRWIADRVDRGWHYGKERNNTLKRHSAIVPYEDLSPNDKQKDRETVLGLIDIFAKQGRILTRSNRTRGDQHR